MTVLQFASIQDYSVHVTDLLASENKMHSVSMDFVLQNQQKKNSTTTKRDFCCDIVIYTDTRKCHIFHIVKEWDKQVFYYDILALLCRE